MEILCTLNDVLYKDNLGSTVILVLKKT